MGTGCGIFGLRWQSAAATALWLRVRQKAASREAGEGSEGEKVSADVAEYAEWESVESAQSVDEASLVTSLNATALGYRLLTAQ